MRSEQPPLFVFATDEQGTLAALQHAASLSERLTFDIVILVPRVVGYGAPLNGSREAAEADALARSYHELASRVGIQPTVRVGSAREPKHLTGRLMLDGSRIVVGGRWRAWRSSPEQQLARELVGEGHDVTFVDVDSGRVHHLGAVHA